MESSMELVEVPAEAHAILAGNTPEEILETATRIANKVRNVIESQGFAVDMGKGRKPFVEVGGWQAAGAMLGAFGGQALHAETAWSKREDREGEIAYTAKVEIKTLSGEVVGSAEGFCSDKEKSKRGSDEYAIKGMAETRAEGRAYRRPLSWVVSMAGYSPTLAEEMGHEQTSSVPQWAEGMNDTTAIATNMGSILRAAGLDEGAVFDRVSEIGREIMQRADNTFPWIAAHVVWRLRNAIEESGPTFEDVSDKLAETEEATAEAVAEDNTTTEENES